LSLFYFSRNHLPGGGALHHGVVHD